MTHATSPMRKNATTLLCSRCVGAVKVLWVLVLLLGSVGMRNVGRRFSWIVENWKRFMLTKYSKIN